MGCLTTMQEFKKKNFRCATLSESYFLGLFYRFGVKFTGKKCYQYMYQFIHGSLIKERTECPRNLLYIASYYIKSKCMKKEKNNSSKMCGHPND